MKLLIQRVNSARVIFEDDTFESIGKGYLVYIGIHKDDTNKDLEEGIRKLINLRAFDDENGKINLSVKDLGYEIMIISNFSLHGIMKKGNRPSFEESAKADFANSMYEKFLEYLDREGIKYSKGRFQTYMKIESVADGPLNLIYSTR